MSLERADGSEVEHIPDRRTIVTALPLKRVARARLAELLGARVVDVRDPVDHVDLILTPSCSPQLIGALRRKYEGARIVVVELDDWDLGIEVPGPVKRILRGGADAYLLADSMEELARKIAPHSEELDSRDAPHAARELPSSATVDDLIAAFLRESVEYSARVRVGEQRVD